MSLKGRLRMFWRDFVRWGVEASYIWDEQVIGRLFLDSGTQLIWSSLDVHKTLLEDEVRVEAFRKAIYETVKEGDSVLDVGTGMGILAFFAAEKAGKVYAVDPTPLISAAEKTARKNKIENIEFIRSDIKDVNIPKVDVVICELIGMGVLDEGIVEKMGVARKFLKEGGKMIPQVIDVYVAPVESSEVGIGFWGELYGIDYSEVESVPKETRNFEASGKTRMLAKPLKVFSFDFSETQTRKSKTSLKFTFESDGVFHGCILYFKARLSEKTVLDTTPGKPLTHWKHIFLPNKKAKPVARGDSLAVTLSPKNRIRGWDWEYSFT
ncbi:MAG: methyltransferase domain-containing protein [Methanobacteriota archaeon]